MTLGVRVTVDAFGIEKEFLRDLLREVADGRSQLPEFPARLGLAGSRHRRAARLDILGYPVGTVMMLRTRRRPVQATAVEVRRPRPPCSQTGSSWTGSSA